MSETHVERNTKAQEKQADEMGVLRSVMQEVEMQKLTFNELDVPFLAKALLLAHAKEHGAHEEDVHVMRACCRISKRFLEVCREEGIVQ